MSAPHVEPTIEWARRRLVLRGDGSIHEPDHATAYVADVHLGKAEAFRAAGVAAPSGVDEAGFARLNALLEATRAVRLIILGDLFHARAGRTPDLDRAFVAWRRSWPSVAMTLVRGNHDRGAGDPPPDANIDCVDEPWVDDATGGRLAHDPVVSAGAESPTMCGHIHPSVAVRLPGGRLRARCFVAGRARLILPAFGPFTGGARMAFDEADRIFALVDGGVAEVTRLVEPVRRRERVM